MAYGITETGFVIKDLQTIKNELEVAFQAAFGNDLDISLDSVSGQFIGALAKREAELWELFQALYNSYNPDSAEDISLDSVCAIVGITRLPATYSYAIVGLYGDLSTVIPAGHVIQQDETNELFDLDEEVIISLDALIDSVISIDSVEPLTIYTITINGVDYNETTDANPTVEELAALFVSAIESGDEPVNCEDYEDGTFRVYSDDGIEPFSLGIDANMSTVTQASPGIYTAENIGNIPIPSNTLNEIVNPIAGLDSVNNLAVGTAGREIETDEELRIRRRLTLLGFGKGTDEAIRNSILQEVEGVSACSVISNRHDDEDEEGRPGHSVQIIVEGGDDEEIASKIWDVIGSGIEMYGEVEVSINDSMGNEQVIKFSRPESMYIWTKIDYDLYDEEEFPEDGEDLIKDAIVEWTLTNMELGTDLIYQRLAIPIYTIPGVGSISISVYGTTDPEETPDPGDYASDNIIIADNQIAVFATERISLTPV